MSTKHEKREKANPRTEMENTRKRETGRCEKMFQQKRKIELFYAGLFIFGIKKHGARFSAVFMPDSQLIYAESLSVHARHK